MTLADHRDVDITMDIERDTVGGEQLGRIRKNRRVTRAAVLVDGDLYNGSLLGNGDVDDTVPVGDPIHTERQSEIESAVSFEQLVGFPFSDRSAPVNTPNRTGNGVGDVEVAALVEGKGVGKSDLVAAAKRDAAPDFRSNLQTPFKLSLLENTPP